MSMQSYKQFIETCRQAIQPALQDFIETYFQLAHADTVTVFVPRRIDITRDNAEVLLTPDLETLVKRFLKHHRKEGVIYGNEPVEDALLIDQWKLYFIRRVTMTLVASNPDVVSHEPTEEEWKRRAELRQEMLDRGFRFLGNPVQKS